MVDEIERRVVREPSPPRAAAGLPRVARPRQCAEILSAIVRIERLELRADLHVLVGTDVVRAPDFLARCGIEGCYPPAHSHLAASFPRPWGHESWHPSAHSHPAAARSDDDFALDHYRGHGNCLAAGEIT